MNEELRFRVLRLLEAHPDMSQRELAHALGFSLGKTNYCLQALIEKGLIKARNFRNSQNKMAYAYKLTPQGIKAKVDAGIAFLRRKQQEYETLQVEIEVLRQEVEATSPNPPAA